MRQALLIIISIMLSGCISYTNDKGQRCLADIDPIAAVAMGGFVRCYGKPDENNSKVEQITQDVQKIESE
ncbi:hypothetical protein AB7360_03450 [Providencia alcalifaciens]|uniref:hypothetical protein n=1 Tax=Providencia alcalifaciens TaxID=126385 RepID=UPI0032DB3530